MNALYLYRHFTNISFNIEIAIGFLLDAVSSSAESDSAHDSAVLSTISAISSELEFSCRETKLRLESLINGVEMGLEVSGLIK